MTQLSKACVISY